MPQKVLGLDILPGRKKFAAIIITDEGIVVERKRVEKRNLIEYINRNDIEIVAIDNIWEINEDSQKIKHFIKKTGIELIQVTGKPRESRKVSYLAKEHNLHSGGKLNPSKTAEIAARLFFMGEGARVNAIKDQTKISVVRSRSLGGAGGQRQAGFERSISSMVQSVVRDIKQTLKKNDFPFDFFSRKKKHGIKSGRFLVYVPYQKVKEVIKEIDTDEVKVEVEPIERNRLTFLEPKEEFKKKRLFCGVDPGRTVGLALLDLNGNVIKTYSKKGIQIGELIGEVYRLGTPILIATDVADVPHFVEEMRKKCALRKTEIFRPQKDIPTTEKWDIIRELGADVSNTHERDALVAAFRAYTHYKKKFNKIDKILSYIPLPVDDPAVKELVVSGETIAMAISKVLSRKIKTREEKKKEKSISTDLAKLKKERDELFGEIAKLRNEKEELRKWIAELEDKLDERNEKIDELKWKLEEEKKKRRILKSKKISKEVEKTKNKKMKRLKREGKRLRKKIRELKEVLKGKKRKNSLLNKLLRKKEEEVAVKIIDSLTKENITELKEEFGMNKEDILWVQDPSNTDILSNVFPENGLRAIIAKGTFPKHTRKILQKANIPLLTPSDFSSSLTPSSKIFFLSKKEVNQAIENAKLRLLPEKEKKFKILEKSIEEYRKKRQI